MKRILQISMVLCVLLIFAGSAWSYSLTDGTDVGGLDALIASDTLNNSGDATELAWVETVTGNSDLVMDEKYTDMGWLPTTTGGVYAIDLRHNPAYFLVKIGGGASTGINDHFLYENLASLDWGVVELTAMGLSVDNITAISHVGEFNGTSVPEPLTVLLLGLGLVGLGGARRFEKN